MGCVLHFVNFSIFQFFQKSFQNTPDELKEKGGTRIGKHEVHFFFFFLASFFFEKSNQKNVCPG